MKISNYRIYNKDQAVLVALREDYIMLGFDTSLDTGVLTVYSRRRRKTKKRREHNPERHTTRRAGRDQDAT